MDSHGPVCWAYLTHLYIYLALLAGYYVVCSGLGAVTVTVEAGEGFEGTRKVLTCRYAWIPPCPDMPDATCTLELFLWKKGSDNIGYLPRVGNAQYRGEYNEPDYIISTTDINAGCNLTIQSVAQTDSGTYTCDVYTGPISQTDSGSAVLTVRVIVSPSTITLTYDGMSYSNGGSIPVVAGDVRQFTCNTPGVYPQTTFTWTLPSGITTDQLLGTPATTSITDNTVDSSNTITVTIPENPATSQLTCGATNSQDGSTDTEIDITVTLDVKVPPKEVKLLESGSELGDSLTVDQGTSHTLECLVPGIRPDATIQWFTNAPSTGVGDPTSSPSNGLVDTSGSWSFTASRIHHKQEVKCVANTSESTQPYPADAVIIDVNGPPNTPVIAAISSPLTEGVSTTLTCTADMGYPNDWRLVWSNGNTGALIPGPTPIPPSAALTADQRYDFTSTLDFTPMRQDNGNTIKCAAQRDLWTQSVPEGSSSRLVVQYGPNITSKANNEAGAKDGEDEDLTCIAMGIPEPKIIWYTPNNTEITNDTGKYTVKNEVTNRDVCGIEVTGTLTIHGVDSQRDYGQYTCNTYNGFGAGDSLKINLTGTRRPNQPTDVRVTNKTADSLNVTWTAGYDGGEDQWFHVSYLKTNSEDEETFSDSITGGDNMYTVTGLEEYTDYDIRVYAENKVGRNPDYGQITEKTLVKSSTPPPRNSDITGSIVGGVVGCGVLVAVIIATFIVYRRRKLSPKQSAEDSTSNVQFQSRDIPNSSDGITNDGFQNSGLPDVKGKDQPLAPSQDDPVNVKKKPIKYVPPSKVGEESSYEAVNFSGETPKSPPAVDDPVNVKKKPKKYVPPSKDPTDTYANVGEQQENSGRVVSEDGLIYAEVSHTKTHPTDKPPIQTETSTEYALLDFNRMKEDEAGAGDIA